jgi:excinuclease UvrABC ATPase subunit
MIEVYNFLVGKRIMILTPKWRSFAGNLNSVSDVIDNHGFSQVRVNGKIIDSDGIKDLNIISGFLYNIDIAVDRITITNDIKSMTQFVKSLQVALKNGDGTNELIFLDFDTKEEFRYYLTEDVLRKALS